MKPFLLILVFLKIAFAAFTQPPTATDTVCLPIAAVIKSIRVNDSLQIMKQERDSMNELIKVQDTRLRSKDSSIAALFNAGVSGQAAIDNLTKSRDLAVQEAAKRKEDMDYYNKLFKQQKNRKTWAIVGGIVAVVATVWVMK